MSLKDQLSQYHQQLYEPYDPETGQGLARPEPTAAELADNYSAPGRAAEHLYGVVFRADYETVDDGMCRQARLHARALSAHVPLLLTSINHRRRAEGRIIRVHGDDDLPEPVREEVGPLRHTRLRNSVVFVYHTLIKNAAALKNLIVPAYLRSQIGAAEDAMRSIIVYTPWERSTVSADVVKVLNRLGQVWLQCERNRQVFVDAGVSEDKIRLIPNAYDPTSGPAVIPLRSPEPPSGRWYYNIGKWEPRKGQHELIGAFLLAHQPTDRALLTIKTAMFGRWKDYPLPDESLRYWSEHEGVRARGWTPERIERAVAIYDRFFTEGEMCQLHAMHNIYVSASHAEGWDYPAFDAVSAGNRLVYVPFGGAEDFHAPEDLAVPCAREPVHKQYQWDRGAEWASYTVEQLSETMRAARVPARRAPPAALAERFGAATAGRRMVACIREIVRSNYPNLESEMFVEAL